MKVMGYATGAATCGVGGYEITESTPLGHLWDLGIKSLFVTCTKNATKPLPKEPPFGPTHLLV